MGKFTQADVEIKAKDQTKAGVASAKKGVGGLTKAVKAYGAEMAAAYLIIRKAYKVVKELTEAYGIQQLAVTELESALKATGKYTPQLSSKLQQLASDLQKLTTFGDEETLSATAMLQSLAELNEEGLLKLIPSVQDLAIGAFKGDLMTAMTMVGKTLGSSTNALSRYGIEIDMTATQTEKLAQLQDKINEKWGGRAQAVAKTYTGQVKQLKDQYGDLKEDLGEIVAYNMPAFIELSKSIIGKLQEWTNEMFKNRQEILEWKRELGGMTKETIQAELAAVDKEIGIYAKLILRLENTIDSTGRLSKQHRIAAERLKEVNPEYDKLIKRQKQLWDVLAEVEGKLKDQKIAMKEVVKVSTELKEASDEWANTIIWTGQVLDDLIEMTDSQRESQQWLNETIKEGEEDLADYAAAMLRVQENAILMEGKQEAVTTMFEEQNKAIEAQKEAVEALTADFIAFADAIEPMGNLLKEMAKQGFSTVLRAIGEQMMAMAALFFSTGQFAKAALSLAGGLAAIVASNYIKSLAKGGIVTQPTLALIGESGPEAVVPLGKGGGIGTTINVYVQGSIQTEKDLAQSIAREIGRQEYKVT